MVEYTLYDDLEEIRNKLKLMMVYKIVNEKVILPTDLLPRVESRRPSRKCTETTVGIMNQLTEPLARTDIVGKTFFYSAPKLWNDFVTSSQANAPSVLEANIQEIIVHRVYM